MHALFEHLCKQLGDRLRKRRVVLFYDLRQEFEQLIDELAPGAGPSAGIERVRIDGLEVHLARFKGSYFAVRFDVEDLVAVDTPDPLLIYLPGAERDPKSSVLMELEKAGTTYEPQLKRLARNVLRQVYTDGDIDEMLKPEALGYQDVVTYLRQAESGGQASILKTIFGEAGSEAILVQWLADADHDTAIGDKEATGELYRLVEARLGLTLASPTRLAEARAKVLRYVLVNEFRSDLACEPPASIGMLPTPPLKDHLDRAREVAQRLRKEFPERYVAIADQIEGELALGHAAIDPACLGSIDTFRFEEKALLHHAGELAAAKRFDESIAIVTARARSFWADRDVARQAQWGACRVMAELGLAIERVSASVGRIGKDPAKWVAAYTAEQGWHQVDRLHRQLESWIAQMDEEPEAETALGMLRRDYDELLKGMTSGFVEALRGGAWTVSGVLHQTRVYRECVEPMPGRVAYFLVDALRFEMGRELADQLQGALELSIRPAVAALPTITPVGMAALLPGASSSFAVVAGKSSAAAQIEGNILTGLVDRQKLFKAKHPDAADMALGELLKDSAKRLASKLLDARFLIVRSTEIDLLGEADGGAIARHVMDTAIGNIARAVRKLAGLGFGSFVITADHGHLFSLRREDDMKIDPPGGRPLEEHRRCWIGYGGATPSAAVRVPAAEFGYASDLEFVFPTTTGVFKAGGGLAYHHGGLSLQEVVVPVITFRMRTQEQKAPAGATVRLVELPAAITNRTFVVRLQIEGDLLTQNGVAMRPLLIGEGEQVGQAGMASVETFDRTSGVVQVKPPGDLEIGMMLKNDACKAVRVVIQDPATDAVLAQSDDIPVRLGI
jgi:PglZ domain